MGGAALDPAVGSFLQSLQQSGLSSSQISTLAGLQNDPGAWQATLQNFNIGNSPAAQQALNSLSWDQQQQQQQQQQSGQSTANAQAQIKDLLDQYGLGSLAQWAYGLVAQGYDATYIMQELRNRPEFKARFPAIEARQKAGLPPISPGEYVQLERSYDTYLTESGLKGMYDRKDLYTKWITGDVSPTEVKSRADEAYRAAMAEPVEVRAELTRLFGVNAGGAAISYFLDPKNSLPKLTQLLQSGETAGASIRAGYGLLTADEATRLTQQGINTEQAQQGFGALGKREQLFAALPGEFGYQGVSREQQLGAAFGSNAQAQQAIEAAAAQRQAVFQGASQYGISKTGVGGLGGTTT